MRRRHISGWCHQYESILTNKSVTGYPSCVCISAVAPWNILLPHFPGSHQNHQLFLFLPLCFSGLGGACGYLVGAMDWGHSVLGRLLGSEYQVIYFFSALTWGFFLTVHLFSIPEQSLCKDPSVSDCSSPSALHLLGSHSNGYGALSKEPSSTAAPTSVSDVRPRSYSALGERPRSFSALGEANAVTSSSKQPNKVRDLWVPAKSIIMSQLLKQFEYTLEFGFYVVVVGMASYLWYSKKTAESSKMSHLCIKVMMNEFYFLYSHCLVFSAF